MHVSVNSDGGYFARALLGADVHYSPMTKGKIDTAWFKAEMKQAGVTQDDIASVLGRDRTVVSRIINGRLAMEFEHVKVFARALGCPVETVLAKAGHSVEDMAPAVDRQRLSRAMALLDKIISETGATVPLDARVEIVEKIYMAGADTPDVALERDIYLRLFRDRS